MIIGVTGGAGFIGSYVVKAIRERGHDVIVLDHKRRRPNSTSLMLGDVRDATIVQELAAHVNGIIHLAAVLGTSETIDNPLPAAETNILGTLNVFEAGARYNVPVVFAAVGNSGIGRGTYCITKSCGEEFVHMYREDRGARIASVRPMNAYGPGQTAPMPYGPGKVGKIMPSFVCSALSDRPMRLYGGGRQVSDMVWVEDVASVFLAALEALWDGATIPHPIDVGQATPSTVRQVAETVADLIPEAQIEDVPMRPGEPEGGPLSDPKPIGELIYNILNTNPGLDLISVTRAVKRMGTVVSADINTMRQIGVNPFSFVPLQEGAARTVEWYRQNEGVTWSRA